MRGNGPLFSLKTAVRLFNTQQCAPVWRAGFPAVANSLKPGSRGLETRPRFFGTSRNNKAPVQSSELCRRHRAAVPSWRCRQWRVFSSGPLRAARAIRDNLDYYPAEELLPTTTTESQIRVVDYSDGELEIHDVAPTSLQDFLQSTPKPDWATCRWIYVNGLNRETIQRIGEHKRLHPLAIEDVLDVHTPTKVDWYDDHCFVELTMQKLASSRFHHTSEQAPIQAHQDHQDHQMTRYRPLSPGRFGMLVEQVSVFVTADDTVISFFEFSGQEVFDSLMTRLNSTKTVLRSSNDPSLLLHAILDEVVDLALPIGKAIGREFRELELAVLTRPALSQSEQLYILRSGCTILMDTISPIGGLLRTLRDHSMISMAPKATVANKSAATNITFISPMAQAYLSDVHDHINMLSRSLQMSIRSSESLTSLIFNTIAARQNESVRQLTIVSVFFLPLTFLTGYFGMNFDPMPVVNQNSDLFFWYIAAPLILGMTCMLLLRAARSRSMLWKFRRSTVKERKLVDRDEIRSKR